MNILSKFSYSFELKIVQWNCFKMTQARLHEFRLFLEQFQPDIVSVQEIKMNREQANLFLRFDGYKVYYKPRSTGDPECGGGTAVVVKETVDHSQITNLEKDPDHIGIKVETADYCFNLFSLYSPSNSLQKETVFKYKKYGPNLFLVGDLNSKTPSLGCRALVSDSNGKVLRKWTYSTDFWDEELAV